MHIPKLPLDRFVHLDADTVVFDEIAEMIDLLDDNVFVGVPDHPPLTVHENVCAEGEEGVVGTLFGIERELAAPGVNAGVFGATMEGFETMREVMQMAYESQLALPRRDQSLLNIAKAVVQPPSAMLDVRYNFRHSFRRARDLTWTEVRTTQSVDQPFYLGEPIAVMHFIGPSKPWHPDFDKESTAFRLWDQFSGFW
jgi:lipopolysaccharide biosynthesis glycosyltransferase